jgi:acyl carrier protein
MVDLVAIEIGAEASALVEVPEEQQLIDLPEGPAAISHGDPAQERCQVRCFRRLEKARRAVRPELERMFSETREQPARLGGFARWDSLAHLRLILALEEKIGRELDRLELLRRQQMEEELEEESVGGEKTT